MPQREREREREKQTLWMPETWRTETAAVAVAPTKREATEKALKGMKWESPGWPLLKEDIAHPNWAALALSPSPTTTAFVLLHLRSNSALASPALALAVAESCSAPNSLFSLSKICCTLFAFPFSAWA